MTARRLHATLEPLVPLDHIIEGELYFVTLARGVYEGELRVGLARAEAACDDRSMNVAVRWYARKQWLTKQTYSWGKKAGPTFEYARDPGNARSRKYITSEAMSDFLPLRPELTQKGKDDDEKPRLTGENVRALRELCRRRGLLEEEREIGEEEDSLDGEEEEEEEEEVEGESEGAGESEGEVEAAADEGDAGEGEGEVEAGEEGAAEAVDGGAEREAGEDVAMHASHRPRRERRPPPPLPPGSTYHQRGSAL